MLDLDELIDSGSINKDNLKTDSRDVGEGDIFVALRGTMYDGHDYAGEVLSKGARRIICEKELKGLSRDDLEKVIKVKDTRKALSYAAKRIFEDPSSRLKVFGVTGTNGKTTTVFLIDNILTLAGVQSGMITTVFTRTSGNKAVRSSMTTPDALTLNRLLADMVSGGEKAAVLEISSHALSQDRTSGIGLDSAVFTNITPEHLDYHGNMENYLKDKVRIFGNLKENGVGVLNIDDPLLKGLIKDLDVPRLVTFGTAPEAEVRAENIVLRDDGSEFDLVIGLHGRTRVSSSLIGNHNIYNMMAAAAALSTNGFEADLIRAGLENAPAVPGRTELVTEKAPFKVFVDYAHTPNALESVLLCLRGIAPKKLICVFGCGGDRDKTKRPVMGQIASRVSDHVILTSDNPRSEDPEDIVRQIEKGVLDKTKYCIILQRKEAIRKAIEMAQEGDVVIIAGKGHEDYQIIGDKVLHFDDKEVASQILKESGY
ncbi:MAG: UDP-N-acetylmuramoyl-L-alanyl-D-glutamate--2,6-diaminopimelate ligase [Candidatus Omnitrophota bacterium]